MTVGYKLVIVTRKDLKLSPGKLAAQASHAAVDCALKAKRYHSDDFEAWHSSGGKKVLVKAEKLEDFYALKQAAERIGLTTSLIQDAGHTEIAPGTVTVLGIGPGRDSDVDKVTGHLSLY